MLHILKHLMVQKMYMIIIWEIENLVVNNLIGILNVHKYYKIFSNTNINGRRNSSGSISRDRRSI